MRYGWVPQASAAGRSGRKAFVQYVSDDERDDTEVKEDDQLAVAAASAPEPEARDQTKQRSGTVDVDELWKSLNKPVRKPGAAFAGHPGKPAAKGSSALAARDSGLSDWLQAPSVRASSRASEEVDQAAQSGASVTESKPRPEKSTAEPAAGDLKEILHGLKRRKESVLTKTKQDWLEYKQEHQLHDELDAHLRDKNRFSEKVSFLQRAEMREYELEQDLKRRRK